MDESKYRLDPQQVELVDTVDPQDTSLIYKLDRNNIFVKSKDYNHKPFPTKYYNDDNFYVPSSGYVNPTDVYTSILNYNLLINEDISLLQQGSYIWTAKDKTQLTWGVYKYMSTDFKITSITASASNIFTVTLNKYFAFEKGDVIGINDVATGTDGFYTINKVELNVLSLDSVTDVPATEDTYTANTGFITRFKAVRVSNLTEANNNICLLYTSPSPRD